MNTLPDDKKIIEEPVLDQERQKRAREYSRRQRRMGLGETALSLALLLILIFSGVSQWFTDLLSLPVIAAAVVYFVVLLIIFELLTLPMAYYRGLDLPRRYGISIQKFKSWLADQAKGGAIGLVLGVAAVAAGYWLLLNFADYWWLMAWGVMIIVSILMTIIAPIFLVPWFYKVKPLPDIELKSRLEQLVQKARTEVQGIFTLDYSSKVTAANAGLMGMGRTRRIVVSDTLVQQYTIPEIEVVTAHEIGHHINRDIFRIFVIQSAVYLIGFSIIDAVLKAVVLPLGFGGIADPAALPLLMLILGAFSALASPLLKAYSRHVESQADRYALVLTDNPKAFINAMTRLVNQNLAVACPSAWEELLLYDHPGYNRRVEHARIYEKWRENRGKS